MGRKPFTTVDEQISLLEKRGIRFSDKQQAASFLLREGYYTVINGYKDAFLDREATNLAKDDRYPNGLPFEYFELLYMFDTLLRRMTMSVLLDAEATMKTAVVYAFCDKHREDDAYLDPANYCSKSAYHNKRAYTQGLIKLLSVLQGIRENRHHKKYIDHYINSGPNVPLWVAAKCMTFGNISSFFDYQQQPVKTMTCVVLSQALDRSSTKQKDLTFAFRTLPDFRNICAHNERFYCARVGKNKDKGFPDLMRALSYVIPDEALSRYAFEVYSLLGEMELNKPNLKEKIMEGMGADESEIKVLANV